MYINHKGKTTIYPSFYCSSWECNGCALSNEYYVNFFFRKIYQTPPRNVDGFSTPDTMRAQSTCYFYCFYFLCEIFMVQKVWYSNRKAKRQSNSFSSHNKWHTQTHTYKRRTPEKLTSCDIVQTNRTNSTDKKENTYCISNVQNGIHATKSKWTKDKTVLIN